MSLQAKFRLNYVQRFPNADSTKPDCSRSLNFGAVYDNDPNGANRNWSEATPSGNISMVITNPGAFEQFEAGKDYLLTFEEAPVAA